MNANSNGPVYLVPEDFHPRGQFCDQQLKLADDLLEKTSYVAERRDGKPFPYGCDRFARLFGGDANDVRKAAEASGLFDRSESYQNGKKAKTIRLRDEYRDGRFRIAEPNRRPRGKQRSSAQDLNEVCQWLLDNLRAFRLPERPVCRDNWDAYASKCWQIGKLRATQCKAGRFHSTLTSTSRVLRSQMWVDLSINVEHMVFGGFAPGSFPSLAHKDDQDSALWELDVKTCQPLIVGANAMNEGRVLAGKDVYRWLEICQREDLYTYLAERVGTDRDGAKKQVCYVMCGTESTALGTDVGMYMKSKFKSIWEYLQRLKKEPGKKPDHRNASFVLHRDESMLMIKGSCASLMQSHRSVPIGPIHDAIICPNYHRDAVRNAICTAFKQLGVEPRIEENPITEVAR